MGLTCGVLGCKGSPLEKWGTKLKVSLVLSPVRGEG